MKVLTHEADSLRNAWRREVNGLKLSYYRLCFDQVEALKQERKLKGLNARLAVLSLFGMMNWIYTWYRPDVDPDAGAMAEQMAAIFLRGIYSARARRSEEHTSELQSRLHLVCRLLLEKKKRDTTPHISQACTMTSVSLLVRKRSPSSASFALNAWNLQLPVGLSS